MKETIRVLLSEEEVDRRIKEVADQINRDYAGKEVHLICVLKGGVFFMCELAKRITVPVSLDFMSVSSYGDDTKSSGVVRIVKDLDQPLENYLNVIDGYVATLCSLREAASRQPVAFSAEIVRYVDANFTRPELYLKSVTEHFNLSEKALQLAVRDATGMSFAEYLETRRLEMACRLLLQTDLSVAEVAEQSGFALYNTFYKSFKRHFDCSPNEYRQSGPESAR